jgi:hypothetical protein
MSEKIYMKTEAVTDKLLRAIYLGVALQVITSVIFISVLYDIIVKSTSLGSTLLIFAFFAGLLFIAICYCLYKYVQIPVIRRFGIFGGLAFAPVMLFVFSIPAAVYFLVGGLDISVAEWPLLMFVTLSFVVFVASMVIFAIPSDHIIAVGSDKGQKKKLKSGGILLFAAFVIVITAITIKVLNTGFRIPCSHFYLALPVISVLMVLNSAEQLHKFRKDIIARISRFSPETTKIVNEKSFQEIRSNSQFFNLLRFQTNYLETVSGDTEYLENDADDIYARCLISSASRTFDPALLQSLNIIASGNRFGETIRHEAAGVLYNIEKYYADPGKNVDMIVQEGIAEKTASARKILTNPRTPQTSEVLRLLREPGPDLRRIALAAIGKYKITELLPEVIQSLSSPETEKEAYYLLNFFGPSVLDKLSESYATTLDNESVSLLKIRLLASICSNHEINNLADSIWQGSVRIKNTGIKYLKETKYKPEEAEKGRYTEHLLEILGNITKILSLEFAAHERKCFVLSTALQRERELNTSFAYDLLGFIIGEKASLYLRKQIDSGKWADKKYAAEIINIIIDEPLRGPILALLDSRHPKKMIRKLQYFYPFKAPTDSTLVSLILNSDQNIAGPWVKACALRKVAEGKLTVSTEMLISYLFSSRQILQEEAARALKFTDPSAFTPVAHRIPHQANSVIKDVIGNRIDDVALIYEKARFLSLCFGSIPEERLISLAKKMRYSESSDTRHLPGVITWIIPAKGGRSGLYSLSHSEISDFVFHNPEFIDVLVQYLDKSMKDTVE